MHATHYTVYSDHHNTLHTLDTPDTILQITCCPQQPRQPPHSTPGWRGPAVVPIAGDRSLVQRHTTVPSRAQHLQHSNSLTIPPPASHSLFSFLSEIGRPTPGVRNQLLIYSHLRGLIVSTWKICQTSFLSFWHCLNKCATNMLNIHFSKSTRTQLTGNDLNISRVNNIHGTCDTSVTVSEHSPCSHYILEYN